MISQEGTVAPQWPVCGSNTLHKVAAQAVSVRPYPCIIGQSRQALKNSCVSGDNAEPPTNTNLIRPPSSPFNLSNNQSLYHGAFFSLFVTTANGSLLYLFFFDESPQLNMADYKVICEFIIGKFLEIFW